MADLPTRSHSKIVATTIAGIQGRAAQLIDFGKGSPLRAIVEGFAGLYLWFQGIALQILSATRLSTSQGNDVDTFTADFMAPIGDTASPRLGAQAAGGLLTFTRFTAGPSQVFIPVGATVQTTDGSQDFVVIAVPTIGTYNASPSGYFMSAGLDTITVPAQAKVAGQAGNAQASSITVITSPITGVDAVINLAAFTGGEDQETDLELKARFQLFILGLSRGDYYGTASAIASTHLDVQWKLVESYNFDGSWHPGFYFVVADDGSGAASDAFMQIVTDAVYSVRPLGVQCTVVRPIILWALPSLNITTAPGFDHNTLVGLVSDAVADGINTLGVGVDLDFNRIAAWAYSVQGVTKVSAVRLNSLSGDAASISASVQSQDGLKIMPICTIKAQSVVVS